MNKSLIILSFLSFSVTGNKSLLSLALFEPQVYFGDLQGQV